jgi:hypothetical protein
MTMYLEAGRLFFGAHGRLDVQPVFGGLQQQGPEWFLRFMPNSWDVPGNPTANWGGHVGRFAYCEVRLTAQGVKLRIGLLNQGVNAQPVLFQAFQVAAGNLNRAPVGTDAFPKYWQATIVAHQGKAREGLVDLNWPDADIDHYLGGQIASKLSQILTSPTFAAASAQVVAILG